MSKKASRSCFLAQLTQVATNWQQWLSAQGATCDGEVEIYLVSKPLYALFVPDLLPRNHQN